LDVCPSAYSLLKFFNRLLITLQLLRCWSYSRSLALDWVRATKNRCLQHISLLTPAPSLDAPSAACFERSFLSNARMHLTHFDLLLLARPLFYLAFSWLSRFFRIVSPKW